MMTLMFQWAFVGSTPPPPPGPTPPMSGGGGRDMDFPTRVQFHEDYLKAEAKRKRLLRDDEEIIILG